MQAMIMESFDIFLNAMLKSLSGLKSRTTILPLTSILNTNKYYLNMGN